MSKTINRALSLLLCAALLFGAVPMAFAKEPTTYTVTFDANGGTGVPPEQVKMHGEPLTLSSETPTREGYVFMFWSTCPVYPDSRPFATYQPGDPYSADKSIVLYAIWRSTAAVRSVCVPDTSEVYAKSGSQSVPITIDADEDTWYSVTCSSSDKSVATASPGWTFDGTVHYIDVSGYKRGTATIIVTVTDYDGNTVTDTCEVTVKYTFVQWLIIIFLFGWIWYI